MRDARHIVLTILLGMTSASLAACSLLLPSGPVDGGGEDAAFDGGLDGDATADGDTDADRQGDGEADTTSDADGCVPECEDRQCGPDGCGGYCGAHEGMCEDGLACAADGDCETPRASRWVFIRGGTFMMGSPAGEVGREDDEVHHQVRLTRDFLILSTEVARSEFELLMGYDPSHWPGGDTWPVENMTWHEAAAYCNALSDSAPRALDRCYTCVGDDAAVVCEPSDSFATPYECDGFRLPTEAEWEYAARSGTTTATYGGDLPTRDCSGSETCPLDEIAWWSGNVPDDGTQDVATRAASPWGLFDMLGNVWEWCGDWYGAYSGADVTDPWGPEGGTERAGRGGSGGLGAYRARAAFRFTNLPTTANGYQGFRVVRTVPTR